MFLFFFFQAEDGIRDYKVTGVQTCALPIFDQIVSNDFPELPLDPNTGREFGYRPDGFPTPVKFGTPRDFETKLGQPLFWSAGEIGRASCRERVQSRVAAECWMEVQTGDERR